MMFDPDLELCPTCRTPILGHQTLCDDSERQAERRRQQAALEKLQADYADLLAREAEGGAARG